MKFPRDARLTSQEAFKRVFAKPRVTQDKYFRILSRSNGLDQSRLGMAVSLKVCKQAPGRNRIKRLIRETFRQQQHELATHGGRDYVVLPRPHAATICNPILNSALKTLWTRSLEGRNDKNQRPSNRKS